MAVDSCVVGDLQRDGAMATGWCWSPGRPRERLRVALLVDGVVVAAAVAARLRLDLVRDGLRDGYHGFSLPLPSPMPPATRIEARELASGAVFGRILLDRPADIDAWHARAGALSDRLAGLHGRLGGGARFCDPLASPGAALGPRPCVGIIPAPPLPPDLARVVDPALSLVLDVAGSRQGPAAVQACAMLLRHHGAELVLADDGRGPHSAAFAALAGATHCVDTGGPAARANHGARQARGRALVFLRTDGPGTPCPSALAVLLRHATPDRAPASHVGPRETAGGWPVLAGQPVLSAARRAGLGRAFGVLPGACDTLSRAGLTLLVPRVLFAALGGLDASLEDGASLPFLDLALRAEAAGHEVLEWAEPEEPAAPPAAGAAEARGRWSFGAAAQASKAGRCPDPPGASRPWTGLT